jgi:hypothetical protein
MVGQTFLCVASLLVATPLIATGVSSRTLPSEAGPTSATARPYVHSGVDSARAVAMAVRPVSSPSTLTYRVATFVRDDEGYLIRLYPDWKPGNPTRGGGGLVWVYLEGGAPVVLRRYR